MMRRQQVTKKTKTSKKDGAVDGGEVTKPPPPNGIKDIETDIENRTDDPFDLDKKKEEEEEEETFNNPFLGQYKVSFPLTLVSHGIFLISSGLYLYLSTINVEYQQEIQNFTDDALMADDIATWHANGYQDDYIWQTPIRKVWVSEYTVVYFLAALGFCISGVVDLYQWRTFYSVLMIAAAAFGLASAIYTDVNPHRSIWLNSCSLHLWALDAIAVLIWFNRGSYGNSKVLQWSLCVADVTFVMGTVIGLAMSWYYLIVEPIRAGMTTAGVEVFAALCWLVTATIYVTSTLVLGGQAAAVTERRKWQLAQQQEQDDANKQQKEGESVATDPDSGPFGSTPSSNHHRDVTIFCVMMDKNNNDDDHSSSDGVENIEIFA
jgi:hypothetical protein